MIIVATLLAVLTGLCEPVETLLLGRLINILISYERAQSLSFVLANLTNGTNGTCTTAEVQQILSNVSQSNDMIFCDASKSGNVVNRASSYVCDPDQTLTEETTAYCLWFVALAATVLITRFMAILLWYNDIFSGALAG